MKYLKVFVVNVVKEDVAEEQGAPVDALEDTGEEVVGEIGIILIPGIILRLFGTILPSTGLITEHVPLVV